MGQTYGLVTQIDNGLVCTTHLSILLKTLHIVFQNLDIMQYSVKGKGAF